MRVLYGGGFDEVESNLHRDALIAGLLEGFQELFLKAEAESLPIKDAAVRRSDQPKNVLFRLFAPACSNSRCESCFASSHYCFYRFRHFESGIIPSKVGEKQLRDNTGSFPRRLNWRILSFLAGILFKFIFCCRIPCSHCSVCYSERRVGLPSSFWFFGALFRSKISSNFVRAKLLARSISYRFSFQI